MNPVILFELFSGDRADGATFLQSLDCISVAHMERIISTEVLGADREDDEAIRL